MPKKKIFIIWLARLVAAIIFLQTLYFKFSAAPESIHIFTQLGAEPYGRIITGTFELIASILILIPATSKWGALFGLSIISGAILSHITVLGISVQNSDGSSDEGLLFLYACLAFLACLFLVFMYRKKILLFFLK